MSRRHRLLVTVGIALVPAALVWGCSNGTDYQGGGRTLPTEVPTSQTPTEGGPDVTLPDTGIDVFVQPDTSGGFDAGQDVKTDG